MPDIVPSTPDQAAVELARRFDDFGIDYAIGGALAMGLWSEPRATLDVDLTLFLNPNDAGQVVKVLETLGCLGDFGEHDPRTTTWNELCASGTSREP